MNRFTLVEHRPRSIASDAIPESVGTALFREYGTYLDVQFPTARTGGEWRLTSLGWVGMIRAEDWEIVIEPKVPIANLARLLLEVYELPIETYEGLTRARTMQGVYEQLVEELIGKVLQLSRAGLLQRYQQAERRLPYARGRVDIQRIGRASSIELKLPYRFTERTSDVLENQLPLWTLDRALRAPLHSEATRRRAREAYRQLLGAARLERRSARDVDRIVYDRLSDRYRPAHALCRLLLDGLGPVAEHGAGDTVPFLLNMPQLFERFVARWLARRLPPPLRLQAQERSVLGDAHEVEFVIDLIVYDERSGEPLCVLDTKYKDVLYPAADDVQQVGFYALLKGCSLAGLVYPSIGTTSWVGRVREASVATFVFDLSGDIDASGERFVGSVVSRCRQVAPGPSVSS